MSRNFDASQRKTIWNKYHGTNGSAIDAFGRNMTVGNFEADHIWPSSEGGKTVIENGIPLASLSNEEKSDNFSGIVNGKSFEIKTRQQASKIGILYVNGIKKSL